MIPVEVFPALPPNLTWSRVGMYPSRPRVIPIVVRILETAARLRQAEPSHAYCKFTDSPGVTFGFCSTPAQSTVVVLQTSLAERRGLHKSLYESFYELLTIGANVIWHFFCVFFASPAI